MTEDFIHQIETNMYEKKAMVRTQSNVSSKEMIRIDAYVRTTTYRRSKGCTLVCPPIHDTPS